MAELKPCPFCGGEGYLRIATGCTWVKSVMCKGCGAETHAYPSDQEAAEAWNRRPNEEIADELISREAVIDKAEYDSDFRLVVPVETIKKVPSVNAVVLPCEVGDTVWAIRNFKGKKHPQRGIVGEMYFTPNMKLQIVVKYVARGEWGKTVFLTKEEAEAALEGGKK